VLKPSGVTHARAEWPAHLRGHLLQFDRRPAPALTADVGARLLATAALLELLRVLSARLYPLVPMWLGLPSLLLLAVLAVPGVTGVRLSNIGFVPWREWSTTEQSYLLQVLVIASIVFPLVLGPPFGRAPRGGGMWRLMTVFLPYLCFGFYQELVYRGMVQTALTRRWGAVAGILIANVLYTFGPLHWRYFDAPLSLSVPMFASIFAIGLLFGALYWRSGNLWIVAIMHAVGNAYIVSAVRSGLR
jgi:membrane protease YdiL (CAAX protease family)